MLTIQLDGEYIVVKQGAEEIGYVEGTGEDAAFLAAAMTLITCFNPKNKKHEEILVALANAQVLGEVEDCGAFDVGTKDNSFGAYGDEKNAKLIARKAQMIFGTLEADANDEIGPFYVTHFDPEHVGNAIEEATEFETLREARHNAIQLLEDHKKTIEMQQHDYEDATDEDGVKRLSRSLRSPYIW